MLDTLSPKYGSGHPVSCLYCRIHSTPRSAAVCPVSPRESFIASASISRRIVLVFTCVALLSFALCCLSSPAYLGFCFVNHQFAAGTSAAHNSFQSLHVHDYLCQLP